MAKRIIIDENNAHYYFSAKKKENVNGYDKKYYHGYQIKNVCEKEN